MSEGDLRVINGHELELPTEPDQTYEEFCQTIAESLESEGYEWRSQYLPHADWSWEQRALAAEAAVQRVLNIGLHCWGWGRPCFVPGQPPGRDYCPYCAVRAAIAGQEWAVTIEQKEPNP